MNLLRRISIASRVVFGFAILAVIAVVHATVSYRAAQTASDGLVTFQATVEYNDRVQQLRAQVLELQRNVQTYTSTGHKTLIGRTRHQLQSLREALSELKEAAPSQGESSLAGRLSESVVAYEKGFEFAVEERTLRDDLVHDGLLELEKREQLLRDQELLDDETRDVILVVRQHVHRYLVEPRYALLQAASAEISRVSAGSDAGLRALDLLSDYEKMFVRLVQATRGYLFLVNVVLAGHATEFDYDANQFSSIARERVEKIAESVRVSGARARRFSLYFPAAILLLSTWLAVAVAVGVSRPLGAITETLRRLGQGEKGVVVPGTERVDEIGVMARAANVFRQQNERTESLLEETRALAASLEVHKRQLESSNDELEEFVRTASHDLRTPLVTSAGFLGMVRELLLDGRTDAALRKMDKVDRAHHRMGQLLSDLLELSRVGRTDSERELLDVDALIEQTLSDFKQRFPAAQFHQERLPRILANESRFLQVFENLLGNAMKYAGSTARVRIWARVEERRVRLAVSDDGPGIPPEQHQRVFGLFQRLSSKTEGTGVGLSVVARVMKSHGGRVWIDSQGDGTGTTFWLEFPQDGHERQVA